jgi:cell division protein FtsW (lipid II flippase)
MSYGGSAVLTDYIALGILLNIDLQRDKLIF